MVTFSGLCTSLLTHDTSLHKADRTPRPPSASVTLGAPRTLLTCATCKVSHIAGHHSSTRSTLNVFIQTSTCVHRACMYGTMSTTDTGIDRATTCTSVYSLGCTAVRRRRLGATRQTEEGNGQDKSHHGLGCNASAIRSQVGQEGGAQCQRTWCSSCPGRRGHPPPSPPPHAGASSSCRAPAAAPL